MPDGCLPPRGWRAVGVSVVFGLYAVILIGGARWVGHHLFEGWLARLATMAGVALGFLPWSAWLRPRLVRVLDAIGRALLVGCYLTLVAPFAIGARLFGDPLRMRSPRGASKWLPRRPLPNTLDAARLES